jgi:hypothetical protein
VQSLECNHHRDRNGQQQQYLGKMFHHRCAGLSFEANSALTPGQFRAHHRILPGFGDRE